MAIQFVAFYIRANTLFQRLMKLINIFLLTINTKFYL